MVIPVLCVETWEFYDAPEEEVFGECMPGVYFIQAEEDWRGPVKIGCSADVGSRFNDLQGAHYEELYIKLICTNVVGDWNKGMQRYFVLERHFHKLWEEQNIRGEWFDPDERMKEWMVDPASCGHLVEGFEGIPKDVVPRSIQYEKEREEKLGALGIRVTTLDELLEEK